MVCRNWRREMRAKWAAELRLLLLLPLLSCGIARRFLFWYRFKMDVTIKCDFR